MKTIMKSLKPFVPWSRLALGLLLLLAPALLFARVTVLRSRPHTNTRTATKPRPVATAPVVSASPAVVSVAPADTFAVTKSVVAGGGGRSSSGAGFTLTGTAGQRALGGASGGQFAVSGGFWQAGACAPPAINLQPTAQAICSGMTASLAVNATGSGLTYQWRKGGVPLSDGGNITGATSANLLISPAATGNTGAYDVLITNACGSVSSSSVTLSVDVSPLVPNSRSFAANGGAGSFNVTAVASCNWLAMSNAPWVMITGGGSGPGSGTVNFSVASHTNQAPRTGTISINGGLTFTVRQGAQFFDVPVGTPFYEEIGKLSARGVTLGCGSGNYCPDTSVTREQIAVFIIRALHEPGYVPTAPASPRFLDVSSSHPFYAHIEELAARGITLGCGSDNFCPTSAVTREQMAAFIIRALHAPGYVPAKPNSPRFLDVPESNPFYAHIDELAARGITLGCGGGNYCPTQSVTRAQMAAFLVRAFGL
jgi:hypothetical protein